MKNAKYFFIFQIVLFLGVFVANAQNNMQRQIVRSYEPNTTQLDVSDIMRGIYFIKLSSSKGDVVKKIVVNK